MTSTLENFEQSMGIKPFNIGVDTDNIFCESKLSFESDELSFEQSGQGETSKVEDVNQQKEVSSEPTLDMSQEDYVKISKWLEAVRYRVKSQKGISLFNKVAQHMNNRDIYVDDLYDRLRKLKQYID